MPCFRVRVNSKDDLVDVYGVDWGPDLVTIKDLQLALYNQCKRTVLTIRYRGVQCPSDQQLQYFQLSEELPMFTALVSGRKRHLPGVFVKDLKGTTHVLPINLESTLNHLFRSISELLQIPRNEMVLLLGSRELPNSSGQAMNKRRRTDKLGTLSGYGVCEQCTNEVSSHMRGGDGGAAAGTTFADLAARKAYRKAAWDPSQPDWRLTEPGLVLEGCCRNSSCAAYKKMVCCNRGMGFFDLIKDQDSVHCPCCSAPVQPQMPAFNNCAWRFEGCRGGSLVKESSLEWTVAGDQWEYFNIRAKKAKWSRLLIITKPPGEGVPVCPNQAGPSAPSAKGHHCSLCTSVIPNGQSHRTQNCNHVFHMVCYGALLAAGGSKCPTCKEGLGCQTAGPITPVSFSPRSVTEC